ncbi:MAG: cytochrome-c oxidase, cbb3-type subunit III [Candidatus Thiodiazotropha sp. (ex Lucinoma aequizonata)]|nr:cytochrome-c oxidase, cbb3-type subunit III [Candidatus Thiodiazotropha sp. (ex Lucinoma aequizonata)]MCU7889875.1 cytochrome-c oxidase, cbb3-type subunit III [Candidatus Thiodiazotropha sp. (ex Lucinoma aequizonata)]MCU7894407.1 cytochrome-c oxidase, cbb3-type subunit III [Candidatus Thiodiazotropha sp. (ex Lucinoma aequizonata)]MCU7898011.1 cytochrome-c oxidase, cbb3-type subunit III [Candidatus Thiodiazotropha sp. (ex Lucinoma aequizonata)]MCU7903529.1 cytochrome-c oxidase, cbb3-type subu
MPDNNPFPGENNTGHIWDDNLRELSNPPPRWWMIAFWASVIWWIVYGVLYPMWPVGQEPTQGIMGWSQMDEYKAGVDELKAVRAEFETQIKGMTAKEILAAPGLSQYIVASAKVLFGDNCAPCHGGGGQGGLGYPVLADDDWLYGGAIENIQQTVSMGRKGIMTAHGKILSDAEIDGMANAIHAGDPMSDLNFIQKGCIACHGMDGKGMAVLGSANLTDDIYRFGPAEGESQLESIKNTIKYGVNDVGDPKTREAQMPAFGGRLSEDDIKKLAVFVYKFGGGQ